MGIEWSNGWVGVPLLLLAAVFLPVLAVLAIANKIHEKRHPPRRMVCGTFLMPEPLNLKVQDPLLRDWQAPTKRPATYSVPKMWAPQGSKHYWRG